MRSRSRAAVARLAARAKTFNDRFPYVGPIIWILTLEYFIVQVIVAADWPAATPYSWSRDAISDLGNTRCAMYSGRAVCSPLHWLMNAAFIVLVLAWSLDVPPALRAITGLAGAIGLIGAILFAAHVYLGLGEGGMERVAAYPQTIWLIGFGLYMTRDHYSGGRPWDARKATASASRSS